MYRLGIGTVSFRIDHQASGLGIVKNEMKTAEATPHLLHPDKEQGSKGAEETRRQRGWEEGFSLSPLLPISPSGKEAEWEEALSPCSAVSVLTVSRFGPEGHEMVNRKW